MSSNRRWTSNNSEIVKWLHNWQPLLKFFRHKQFKIRHLIYSWYSLRGLSVIVALAFVLLAILFLVGEIISPKELTYVRMNGLLVRMFDYVESHNELPGDLLDLPPRPGYDNGVVDGWGNKILYITNINENVAILSYGEDGKEGGSGEAADIRFTFDPHNRESYYNVVGVISPTSFTKIKLEAIRDKLIEYVKDNQNLPVTLEEIHLDRKYYQDDNKDYWNNKIIYDIDKDAIILKSLGKDGKSGGERENADIIISFITKSACLEKLVNIK